MKKIIYSAIVATSVFLLLFVASCVKDPTTDSSSEANNPNAFLTVEEAQGFFEESFADATRSGNIDLEQELFSAGDYTPLWGEARTSENDWQGSVDVPIIAGKKYRAIRSEFHHGHAHAYMVEMTQKLIVVKNKETNSTSQFLLTLIPDKDYYAKNKGDISDKFLSSGNKGNFSGYALYTYNGFPVRLNKYSQGEKISGLRVTGNMDNNTFSRNINIIISKLKTMCIQCKTSMMLTRLSNENDNSAWYDKMTENSITSEERVPGGYLLYFDYDGDGTVDEIYFLDSNYSEDPNEDPDVCEYCLESWCKGNCQTCPYNCKTPWCNGNCQTCPYNCGTPGCVGGCNVSSDTELCANNRCAANNCTCCTKGCIGECKAKCLYGDKCHVVGDCICCDICKGICKTGCKNKGACHNNFSGICECY